MPEYTEIEMPEDKSFLRRALDAMVEARSREAQRHIDRHAPVYGCDFGTSKKESKN